MDDAGEFKSSDLAYGDPAPDPYASRGAASIERLLATDMDKARLDCKKKSKQLRYQSGTAAEDASVAMWANRYQAFALHVLKQK